MQAPAIDDHVSAKLDAWYSYVSAWQPPGAGSTGICAECTDSALACAIDVTVWPHDVIHSFVQSLRSAILDVHDSYVEESPWDAESAATIARAAVRDTLVRHADDIVDVLEHCIADKLDTWIVDEASDVWGLRRPAAS